MTDLSAALLALHGVFTFATFAGFVGPLASASMEKRAERLEQLKNQPTSLVDILGPLVDLWLLLEDSIPVFWLFRLFREAPEDIEAAWQHWREEPSVRLFFWISMALLATFPLHFMSFAR